MLEKLRRYEPRSLQILAPVVWERAEGYQVFDPYGNCWIDFTSGIYVANTGHAHPRIVAALRNQIDRPLLHAYLFATEIRARLVEKLVQLTPPNLTKVFLVSTGSESIECAVKLARLYGLQHHPQKTVIVSFAGAFHGRTMGAQMLCSAPDHKDWITSLDPDIRHIPFPRDCSDGAQFFDRSLDELQQKGVDLDRITAFVLESYQGVGGPVFYPTEYVQRLRRWADEHDVLVIFDEIQAGLGRTGKFLAYEHYGVEADLVCCGKGISSCLPLSAVLGRSEILDLPEPGYMTSTHTANPLCCAAALATLEIIEEEDLVTAAAQKGVIFEQHLLDIQRRHQNHVSKVSGRGLVYSVYFTSPYTGQADVELAHQVTERAIQKGLMLFYTHSYLVKMGPPLTIPSEALVEGISVLGEAIEEVLEERRG